MSQSAKLGISQRISMALLVIVSMVWLYDVYMIASSFRAVSLLQGLTAGMSFFIGPALLWRWFNEALGVREVNEEQV